MMDSRVKITSISLGPAEEAMVERLKLLWGFKSRSDVFRRALAIAEQVAAIAGDRRVLFIVDSKTTISRAGQIKIP